MAAADLNEVEVYLPAAGSTFYYASLYFPARVQHELRLLEALRRTITSIPAACSDHGVAIMKLAWWHAEIDALAQGQARHALTRDLLPLVAAEPTLITAYADLVRGTDASIGADLPPDATVLDTRLIATHGGVVRAYAARGGLDDDAQTDAVLRLAALVERAQLLHALYEQRRSGLIPLAGDVLTRHGLDLAATLTARMSPLAAEACDCCAKCCDKCAEACEKFPDDKHMVECAKSCRDCAKACREMIQHLKH